MIPLGDMIDTSSADALESWKDQRDREHAEGLRLATPPHPADDAADDEQNQSDRLALRDQLLTIDQLASLPPPRPLIEGVLDLDNTSVMYGRRGAYKSFVTLDQALSVASGIPWHGHATTRGVALIVVAEGVSGVYQRINAWLQQHPDADPGGRLLVLPEPVNLLSPSQVGEFAELAVDIEAILVFVDTLARCMYGGDENSAKDVGMAVAALDHVRRRSGAHVGAVHHAGKDAKAGARGSSALEAAADTVLEITSSDQLVTVRTTKQKNRAETSPILLKAEPFAGSIVLGPAGTAADEITSKVRAALVALDEIAGGDGAAMTAWVEAAADVDVSRSTVLRLRVRGLDQGWISHDTNGSKASPRYVVTELGRSIAHDTSHTTDEQG